VCTQCRAGCSSVAGDPAGCQPCPAGQTSLTGGLCFSCNALLPNGNFSIGVTGSSAIQCALALHAHARTVGRPPKPVCLRRSGHAERAIHASDTASAQELDGAR